MFSSVMYNNQSNANNNNNPFLSNNNNNNSQPLPSNIANSNSSQQQQQQQHQQQSAASLHFMTDSFAINLANTLMVNSPVANTVLSQLHDYLGAELRNRSNNLWPSIAELFAAETTRNAAYYACLLKAIGGNMLQLFLMATNNSSSNNISSASTQAATEKEILVAKLLVYTLRAFPPPTMLPAQLLIQIELLNNNNNNTNNNNANASLLANNIHLLSMMQQHCLLTIAAFANRHCGVGAPAEFRELATIVSVLTNYNTNSNALSAASNFFAQNNYNRLPPIDPRLDSNNKGEDDEDEDNEHADDDDDAEASDKKKKNRTKRRGNKKRKMSQSRKRNDGDESSASAEDDDSSLDDDENGDETDDDDDEEGDDEENGDNDDEEEEDENDNNNNNKNSNSHSGFSDQSGSFGANRKSKISGKKSKKQKKNQKSKQAQQQQRHKKSSAPPKLTTMLSILSPVGYFLTPNTVSSISMTIGGATSTSAFHHPHHTNGLRAGSIGGTGGGTSGISTRFGGNPHHHQGATTTATTASLHHMLTSPQTGKLSTNQQLPQQNTSQQQQGPSSSSKTGSSSSNNAKQLPTSTATTTTLAIISNPLTTRSRNLLPVLSCTAGMQYFDSVLSGNARLRNAEYEGAWKYVLRPRLLKDYTSYNSLQQQLESNTLAIGEGANNNNNNNNSNMNGGVNVVGSSTGSGNGNRLRYSKERFSNEMATLFGQSTATASTDVNNDDYNGITKDFTNVPKVQSAGAVAVIVKSTMDGYMSKLPFVVFSSSNNAANNNNNNSNNNTRSNNVAATILREVSEGLLHVLSTMLIRSEEYSVRARAFEVVVNLALHVQLVENNSTNNNNSVTLIMSEVEWILSQLLEILSSHVIVVNNTSSKQQRSSMNNNTNPRNNNSFCLPSLQLDATSVRLLIAALKATLLVVPPNKNQYFCSNNNNNTNIASGFARVIPCQTLALFLQLPVVQNCSTSVFDSLCSAALEKITGKPFDEFFTVGGGGNNNNNNNNHPLSSTSATFGNNQQSGANAAKNQTPSSSASFKPVGSGSASAALNDANTSASHSSASVSFSFENLENFGGSSAVMDHLVASPTNGSAACLFAILYCSYYATKTLASSAATNSSSENGNTFTFTLQIKPLREALRLGLHWHCRFFLCSGSEGVRSAVFLRQALAQDLMHERASASGSGGEAAKVSLTAFLTDLITGAAATRATAFASFSPELLFGANNPEAIRFELGDPRNLAALLDEPDAVVCDLACRMCASGLYHEWTSIGNSNSNSNSNKSITSALLSVLARLHSTRLRSAVLKIIRLLIVIIRSRAATAHLHFQQLLQIQQQQQQIQMQKQQQQQQQQQNTTSASTVNASTTSLVGVLNTNNNGVSSSNPTPPNFAASTIGATPNPQLMIPGMINPGASINSNIPVKKTAGAATGNNNNNTGGNKQVQNPTFVASRSFSIFIRQCLDVILLSGSINQHQQSSFQPPPSLPLICGITRIVLESCMAQSEKPFFEYSIKSNLQQQQQQTFNDDFMTMFEKKLFTISPNLVDSIGGAPTLWRMYRGLRLADDNSPMLLNQTCCRLRYFILRILVCLMERTQAATIKSPTTTTTTTATTTAAGNNNSNNHTIANASGNNGNVAPSGSSPAPANNMNNVPTPSIATSTIDSNNAAKRLVNNNTNTVNLATTSDIPNWKFAASDPNSHCSALVCNHIIKAISDPFELESLGSNTLPPYIVANQLLDSRMSQQKQ